MPYFAAKAMQFASAWTVLRQGFDGVHSEGLQCLIPDGAPAYPTDKTLPSLAKTAPTFSLKHVERWAKMKAVDINAISRLSLSSTKDLPPFVDEHVH